MKLECDEGFRPIGGAKSAVCTSPTSFNLNDFGCEGKWRYISLLLCVGEGGVLL